jgi:membrane protease subunit HflK
MEQVLGGSEKVIIEQGSGGGGPGVVPYLPLPEIQKRQQNNNQGANQ